MVVATGFDDEEGILGSTAASYWIPDELDNLRDTGTGDVWVSGVGDGGVIDALRLAHRDFASGKLVASIAQMLIGDGLLHRARKAVAKFDEAPPEDLVASKLATMFGDLATNLPLNVKSLLDTSLRLKEPGETSAKKRLKVHLIGRSTHPYGVKPSPIHLVMLSHAIGASMIHYESGSVVDDGGRLVLRRAGLPEVELDPRRTVVRHGPKAVISALLCEDELAALKARQQVLSDYHVAPIWRDLFRSADAPAVLWRKERLSQVHLAHAKNFEGDHPNVYLSMNTSGVTYTDSSSDGQGDSCLPDNFFGYPLRRTVPENGRDV